MVLPQVKEGKDVRMPWLQVHGKGAGSLVATLVHISSRVVEHTEHGNKTVRGTVCTTNVRTSCTNAVTRNANSTSRLRDQRTALQRVVDALYAVLLHVKEKTGRHLRVWSACIEEGWRGMGKVFVGHVIVGLDRPFNVIAMDPNSNTHQTVLRTFSNLAVQTQQIRPLQGLEAEILIVEVTIIDNGRIQLISMLHDNVVDLLGDHGCSLVVLGVDIVVEIRDDG
jgi:hypothetical protein